MRFNRQDLSKTQKTERHRRRGRAGHSKQQPKGTPPYEHQKGDEPVLRPTSAERGHPDIVMARINRRLKRG